MAAKAQRTYTTQTPGELPPNNDLGEEIVGLAADDQMIEIGGKDFPLNDVVNSAFETMGISVSEWNALPAPQRDARIQAQIAEIEEIAGQVEPRGVPMTRTAPARKAVAPKAAPVQRGNRLPEPHEVDPDKITAMVRTTKGWIVPSKPIRVPKRGE